MTGNIHQLFAQRQFGLVQTKSERLSTPTEAYFYLLSSYELGKFTAAFNRVDQIFKPIPLKLITASANLMCKHKDYETAKSLIEIQLDRYQIMEEEEQYATLLKMYCLQVLPAYGEISKAIDIVQGNVYLTMDLKHELLLNLEEMQRPIIAPVISNQTVNAPEIPSELIPKVTREVDLVENEPPYPLSQPIKPNLTKLEQNLATLITFISKFDNTALISTLSSIAMLLIYILNRKSKTRMGRFFQLLEKRLFQTLKMASSSI